MGMAAPDIVLFVIGAVLFAGAGYALVATGGSDAITDGGSPTNVYSVLFPLEKVEVGKGNVADFSGGTQAFPVNQTNVKQMIVAIQCTDALPGSTFNIRIDVTGPNGLVAEPKFGRCGEKIEIPVPVADVPASTVAQGATHDEALASLQQDGNATKAVGEWTVKYAGSRGGQPLPVGVPAGNPGGAIALTAETWTPELTPVVR